MLGLGGAVAFWSIILPPNGKEVIQEVESTETVLSSVHITGLALGLSPSGGPHPITLEYNGINTVLATLEAPHARQWALDIALDQTIKLSNKGSSDVHVYGYQVSTMSGAEEEDEEDEGEDEDYEMGGSDDDEEITSDFDEEETPRAIPIAQKAKAKKALKAAKPGRLQNGSMDTDEDEDEEEEEEEEEEDYSDVIPEMEDLGSDDVIGVADESEEEEEEEGESEEEEEGESEEEEDEAAPPAKVGGKRALQTPQPGKPAKQARPELPKSAPPKQPQQAKEQAAKQQKAAKEAQQGPKQIPVKASDKVEKVKVEKGDQGEKAPKREEAKRGKEPKEGGKDKDKEKGKETKGVEVKSEATGAKERGAKAPATEEEFQKAVVELIKGAPGGSVKIANVGNAVKRPAGVPKLGAWLKAHPDVFTVTGDGVTLKKK